MMRCIIPSNVEAYFRTMIPIVTFDILESEWTTEKILNFDYDAEDLLAEKYIPK